MATNYREILRLAKLGYSQRSIAASAGCARSTVQRVLERAESNPHTLEELLALSDKGIQQALFPASSIPSTRKPPDYERVHRELAKNGVTLSLLWNEYCEECYASKELPLMYTQFCLHYREYAQQTKATMHLDHKPGEQMEVDWAGDAAKVTDPETGSQCKNRHPSPICTRFEHHFHALKPHLHRRSFSDTLPENQRHLIALKRYPLWHMQKLCQLSQPAELRSTFFRNRNAVLCQDVLQLSNPLALSLEFFLSCVKPFVMGRKNWLFANTPAGARASAVIYSLMETAKETGLDPYKYLLWALREAPKLFETDREWAKKLTPEHCIQH